MRPSRRLRNPLDQSPVDFSRFARPKQSAEVGGHLARFRAEQHAGSVAVEPVHEHRAGAIAVGEQFQHAVDMALRSRAPLHGKAERLVEDEHILILIERHGAERLDVGGIGFFLSLRGFFRRAQRRHAHVLPGFEPRRDFDTLAVDAHFALAHDLVQVGLRQFGITTAEPAVDPHARLVLADRQRDDFLGGAHVGGPRGDAHCSK